jgi:hypothetical protein
VGWASSDALTALVEAGSRTGRNAEAAARSAALLAPDETARPDYERAIELLAGTTAELDLARAYLFQGEWLRHRKRKNDAKQALREAFDRFTRLEALAFARRATNWPRSASSPNRPAMPRRC